MNLKIICTLFLLFGAIEAQAQEVPADYAARTNTYLRAIRTELATIGVHLRTVELRGNNLHAEYEKQNDQEREIFLLASVATLISPLAGGAKFVEITAFSGKRKLATVTAPPASISQLYRADLTAQENERLLRMLEHCQNLLPPSEVPVCETQPMPTGKQISAMPNKVTPIVPSPLPAEIANAEQVVLPAPNTLGQDTAASLPGARKEITVPDKDKTIPEQPLTLSTVQTPAMLSPEKQQEIAQTLVKALQEAQLENLQVGVDAKGDWFISIENRTYRDDLAAIAATFKAIGRILPIGKVTLQLTKDAVAVCSIQVNLADYALLEGGLLTPEEIQRRWQIKPGSQAVNFPVKIIASGNAHFGRVDVAFRPRMNYTIGREGAPFSSDWFIVAEGRATLGKGWRGQFQLTAQIDDEQSFSFNRYLVTHTRWLNKHLLMTGSAGKLREDIYGWYGEVQHDWGSHRIGLVGVALGDHLGQAQATQALGYYEYELGRWGLTTRLGYGTFYETQEQGFILSLQRRFGESTVTTEFIRSEEGEKGINVRLSVPFGPSQASAPSGLRFRWAPRFLWNYLANFAAQGDYFQDEYDLRNFRGQLTAPYLDTHARQVFGMPSQKKSLDPPVGLSFEGTSGLIRIPTADVLPEGMLAFSIAHLGREHSKANPSTSVTPISLGIGFLPNFEIVGRLSVLHDLRTPYWDDPYSLDRSYHIQWRPIRQYKSLPAIAIGAQDVNWGTGGTYIGRATYLVASWQAQKKWRFHVGVGSERLEGVFGGLEYRVPSEKMNLLAEYDGKYINIGVRRYLGSIGSLSLSALGLNEIGGAVEFHTTLK